MTRARIVLTGGPGGGKTTACDLFRRELHPDVTVVAEAATLLFSGGFPRLATPAAIRSTQLAIYHVQRHQEDVQSSLHPSGLLLCDRGTVDGAAYWPGTPAEFFEVAGTSLEAELRRYDAVLFFETAAGLRTSISSGNPWRIESEPEAAQLDQRLQDLWSQHPRFVLVRHEPSFMAKIAHGLEALRTVIRGL